MPKGRHYVPNKCIFDIKLNGFSKSLVAKGYTHIYGVDYKS